MNHSKREDDEEYEEDQEVITIDVDRARTDFQNGNFTIIFYQDKVRRSHDENNEPKNVIENHQLQVKLPISVLIPLVKDLKDKIYIQFRTNRPSLSDSWIQNDSDFNLIYNWVKEELDDFLKFQRQYQYALKHTSLEGHTKILNMHNQFLYENIDKIKKIFEKDTGKKWDYPRKKNKDKKPRSRG